MRVSLDWLGEYVSITQTPEQLAQMLTLSGAEVETVEHIGGDACIELEIKANRPDLLSTMGIAREIAAQTGQKLKVPAIDFPEEGPPIEMLTGVEVPASKLCPRYTARLIRGVTIRPSPAWMQSRLQAVGLRPINNVVDITNCVLMECGQPLHAFDFNTLKGLRIIVRTARNGETITTIDGTECTLTPERLVIADAERPVAVAGVMGGSNTEVTEATVDVLLESAVFDPVSVRRTARTLGLKTDASYRFERTVDPVGCEWASRRAIHLIYKLAGGKVARGLIDTNIIDLSEPVIQLRASQIPRVLGIDVPASDVMRILEALEFRVLSHEDGTWTVGVPPFRREVAREIDLIEEIARVWGYDRIPDTSTMTIRAGLVTTAERVDRLVRDVLTRAGYDEIVTTSFVAPDRAAKLTPWSDLGPLVVINPLRADESAIRASTLPGLLAVRQFNQDRGVEGADLFEASRVQMKDEAGRPTEFEAVGMLSDSGFRELKGCLEMLLDQLGVGGRCTFARRDHGIFAPGSAAAILMDGQAVGWIGELSDEIQKLFDLKSVQYFAEVNVGVLSTRASVERRACELPRFPAVLRDVAIVLDEAVTWEQVSGCIAGVAEPARESVAFVDLYRGEQVGPGKKSMTFSVTYRLPDRTLTNEEVNAAQEKLVAALARHLGARLRG
jgi:phenylalanyl-tRNA synthetase beta chain